MSVNVCLLRLLANKFFSDERSAASTSTEPLSSIIFAFKHSTHDEVNLDKLFFLAGFILFSDGVRHILSFNSSDFFENPVNTYIRI